jgi:hypothetical protein
LVHTTYTTPRRRTILQFSQIRFTLARTFMATSLRLSTSYGTVKLINIAVFARIVQAPVAQLF